MIAVSLLLALLTGSLLPPEVWPGVGWLVLLALMSQVLGYPLINASIPHLPSVVGSVLLFVQPLMTLVAGVIIFGEIPTPGQLRRRADPLWWCVGGGAQVARYALGCTSVKTRAGFLIVI